MPQVTLTLDIEQARAIARALDCYSRLCIGQLQEIPDMCRTGEIPVSSKTAERIAADADLCEDIDRAVTRIKASLGFSAGSSLGIGNPHVCKTAQHAWEAKKALDKAVSEFVEPNPSFRGVNYDGLILRYTDSPAPVAVVTG